MMIPRHRAIRRAGIHSALALLASLAMAPCLSAQQPATTTDTMYLHAHALVSRGQGAEGRALVDSLLLSTPPGTPAYAEGLFWRAVTASKVEDAERDYLRIVIEFPLSPRAEDALIRLAELEMMRGDRLRAQRHLQRLIIEHPNGPARARASYWLARVFFEANDLPRACNELNVARARAAATDVELRNQVDYQAQRCVGVNVVVAPPQAPAPVSGTSTGQASTAISTSGQIPTTGAGGATVPVPPSTAAAGSPPTGTSGAGTTGAATGTASTAGTATGSGTTTPNPPASTNPSTPTATQAPPPRTSSGGSTVPPARRSGPEFTVQVAAFPTKAAADTFVESLRTKGYDVRVWGAEAPFRVRIGRYATRAEASAIAQELRTRMISKDAFVTEAEVR